MDDKALKSLYLEPTPDNPEAGIEKHRVARTIVGLGGWICSKTRPDGYEPLGAIFRFSRGTPCSGGVGISCTRRSID